MRDLPPSSFDGYGRTAQSNIRGEGIANHSWSAVQLNRIWYLCDATRSSGAVDVAQSRFMRNFNDCYFLADPDLFVRNHYPLDSSWMLLAKKPTLHDFLN
jgi:transglutaminase/protease-like cytokinesis protein 3